MTTSDAIVPDDKDWTWVLTKPCPECGFHAAAIEATDVADMILTNATAWQTVLQRTDVRVRPMPDVRTDQWQRTGFRSDGAHFSIDCFARYLIHDPVHHLHDVGA